MPSFSLSSTHCRPWRGLYCCKDVFICAHMTVSGVSGPPCGQMFVAENEATEQPEGLTRVPRVIVGRHRVLCVGTLRSLGCSHLEELGGRGHYFRRARELYLSLQGCMLGVCKARKWLHIGSKTARSPCGTSVWERRRA